MANQAPTGIGAIDLRVENDVEAELALHKLPGAMTTLEYIANHGGEVNWRWDVCMSPDGRVVPLSQRTKDTVTAMINMELLREREYVRGNAVCQLTLVLTDKGRNVVAKHRRRKVVASSVREVSSEEAIAEVKKLSS